MSPSPIIGVDDAVGVSKAQWYVAIVNPRHEKIIAERLLQQGIESFVATQMEMRLWNNGRRKLIERVVIPSKVFIKCTEKRRREIVKLPFILRFLVNRSGSTENLCKPLAVISDKEIDSLKFMLGQSDHPIFFTDRVYSLHDHVRVIRGKLHGLEGQIISNPDGTHHLVVSLSLLGGATVHIDPSDVEKID